MTLLTRHGTKSVQDLFDLYRQRRLNLSPAFQRQSVWSDSDRRLLVNSVFDSIPLPSIYLYQRVGKGGTPVFDVIDGKQRLETLLLFMKKGPLASTQELWIKRCIPEEDPPDWWDWAWLDKVQRNHFLTTEIPTIEVEGELGEIIELFVRINSTGRKLTPQERRNAHYFTSPVLKAAHKLADQYRKQFVADGVVSASQTQRMKHVELITELLLAVNAGGPLNKKSKIDEVIKGDGLTSAEIQKASADLRRAINIVKAVLPHIRSTRLHQTTDFYTLVLLMHRLRSEGWTVTTHNGARNALARSLLVDFSLGVDQVNDKINSGVNLTGADERFRDYLMTVKADTDSRQQRGRREAILLEVLDGVFDSVDPSRSFNVTQRRILWHASTEKKCSLCLKPIRRWEDVSIDHVEAYIEGGKTDLKNAALAHKKCNSAKGAK